MAEPSQSADSAGRDAKAAGAAPTGPAQPAKPAENAPPAAAPVAMAGAATALADDEPSVSSPVQYGRLFRWGGRLIGWAPVLFGATVAFSFLVQVLAQLNVKVLEGTLAKLQDMPMTGLAHYILPEGKLATALLYMVVGVCILLLTPLARILGTYCDNVLVRRLQQGLHDKALTLGPEYHQKHQQGELNTIITNYSQGAELLLTGMYAMPIARGLGFITATCLLIDSLSKVRAMPAGLQVGLLAALVAFPIVGLKLAARLKEAYTKVREKNIALNNELMNSTANPVEVQVMGAQRQRSEAFGRRAKAYFSEQLRAAIRSEIATQFQASTVRVLQILFVLSAAYFAYRDPDSSRMVVVSVLGFIMLIPSVVSPLQEIVSFVTGIQRSWPAVEVVIDLLEAEPEIQDRPGAKDLHLTAAPAIELDNASFAYEAGAVRILDGVTHRFEPGEVTAIVARSGGGKTSLLNLICRLRDPQAGAVKIDGSDLRDLKVESVRRNIAKASQFPLFIVDTIRANLQLAKAGATDAELEGVCRKTGLWDILTKVSPQSPLDFVLPRNEGLSGGERRQLSVTRAMIYQPRVLLLDEPTTGVDATSRQALIQSLRRSCEGMTVLLVDHDMNFVRQWADRVCVLDDAKVVEQGTPAELLAQPSSLYRRLWEDYNKVLEE